ncbi:MAG: choice-of-anchor D domain-containing protein [Treponema sp.]|jgi:PBP1b-binding outer membrane lipoprotein LpoB|nr:choice-of-anchor D domain-containing protein [Treponema sp.]
MKKLFAVTVIAAVAALVLAGCDLFDEKKDGEKDGEQKNNTTLKIQNESFSDITHVMWSNISFTGNADSIEPGSFISKNVNEGSGYIYFRRTKDSINARTDEVITIRKNEQKEFRIIDNTIIVDVDNQNNKGTFNTLGVTREPQITVKVGTSIIEQFGDYDFGSVLFNKNKDITFTIENSGKAELKMNVIEGNVINLANNNSGYFSITQQPLSSMTISPGSSTTFVISFNPRIIGENFNAEVNISTNSEKNAEFSFRVKGSGRDITIGDVGPGNGIIFYVNGNQYKECSGDLGKYSWYDAVSTARNHKGNGFSDWYLPTKEELNLVYLNLKVKGFGSFPGSFYWSSDADSQNAWCQFFEMMGSQEYKEKFYMWNVVAVRSFIH